MTTVVVNEGEKPQPPELVPNKAHRTETYLLAFTDGSYKKITAVGWKHSQWIHFTLPDKTIVRVNPDNVNYMHQGILDD